MVTKRGQFAGQMAQEDALTAAMRLTSVGEQADPQRPVPSAPTVPTQVRASCLATGCPPGGRPA